MRKSLVKKLTAFALVGVLAFSAVACRQETDGTTGTDKPGETTAEPGDTTTDTPETTEAPPVEATPDVPDNRYDATETPRTGNNATAPLVLQTGTLDGKFSSFFATSAYDVDVVGMTSLGLLYYDKNGEPRAGVEHPSFAYSYTQEVSDDNSQSKYTIVLKNGIVFSDGEPVTIKDVLFSMYVLADLYYDGSSTFYSLPIVGMEEYRFQTSSELLEQVTAAAEDILEAGISGEAGSPEFGEVSVATAEQQEQFWGFFPQAGVQFAQNIIDYVNNNYRTDRYAAYLGDDITAEDVKNSENLANALGMVLWGFGSVEDGVMTDALGAEHALDGDTITAELYWENILGSYGYNLSADDGINYEAASGSLNVEEIAKELFIAEAAKIEGGVASISGITETTVTGDDGVERDAIEVILNGVDPTAIFKLGVTVNPMHYYTDGFSGDLNDYGVSTADRDFIAHLKNKNVEPVGAGPYVFEDYTNNVVTYTANDSYLMGSPKIQTLRYQEVAGGSELDVLLTNDVHFSNPSASQTIINSISEGSGDYAKLNYLLVDNDGYGYVGIQGQVFSDLRVRQALAHAMSPQLAVDDFYGELASVNNRTMTKVQWAFPENPDDLFPFDETGETSKNLLIEAGYIYDEATNVMSYPENDPKAGTQFTVKMTLPSAADSHPAGTIFLEAQTVLESIGVATEIEVDANLLGKLSTAYESGVQIWAAAWGNGGVDPDMFQIWYSDPAVNTGTSAARSGLYYLFENGDAEQQAMLTELNELIISGRSTLDQEERKQIYHRALELSTGLAVEVPTYQRKNMFAYNDEVIKTDSLITGDDVTPFQSPLARIWEVELND